MTEPAKESFFRRPGVVRAAALVVVMVCLLCVLIRQRQSAERAETERAAQAAAHAAAHAVEIDYDNPKGRAEAPLETPDYLGEPGFMIEGHAEASAKKAYETARSASGRVRDLKAARAAKAPHAGFTLPRSPRLPTQRQFLERYVTFRMREFEAYRKLTKDEDGVKKAGEHFLRAYIQNACGAPEAPAGDEVLKRAREAIEAGSGDPMVRAYAAFVEYRDTGDVLAAEEVWGEVVQELRDTKYPRIVQVYTRFFADEVNGYIRIRNSNERRQALVVAIVRWLEQESRRPEWADCVHYKLNQLWSGGDQTFQKELVVGCLNSGRVDPFIVHWLAGAHQQDLGWQSRGWKWASDTSDRQWAGFEEHMERGVAHLEYAWLLRPGSPYPPAEMITAAQGGFGSDYDSFDWFLRTVECRFDHYAAYNKLLTSLLPRWGGRIEHFEQFSRACIETDRFDTFVPYVFLDVLDFVRGWEFKQDWDRLREVKADGLIDEFLKRRARYRRTHPGEALHGDSAYYRTRLGLLLEKLGREPEAIAEFRAAGDDIDAMHLQDRNRPGLHLLRRLHAAQGAVRGRVLRFDEALRKRWPADTDPAEIDRLEQELRELRQTAPDEVARKYYDHAGRMLGQLRSYFQGEWVELSLADGGLGWETRADDVTFTEGADEVLLSRAHARTPHVWARPLAHFDPPLVVEATIEPVSSYVFIEPLGVQWTKPDLWSERDWDKTQPFVGLSPHWGINSFSGRQVYSEMASFSTPHDRALDVHGMRKEKPGARRVSWKLWRQVYEGRIEGFSWIVHLPESIAADGILSFGEPYPERDAWQLREHAGQWRLSGVRVRRLEVAPPHESAPIDERESYWSRRTAADADDAVAQVELCTIHWEQRRLDEVLERSRAIHERWPGLERVHRLRGMALLELRRYREAQDVLETALQEPGDDLEAILAAATILAAARQEDLRNGRQALSYANLVKNQSYDPDAPTLAVLAAAHAEIGDFQQAQEMNRQAIERADEKLRPRLVERQELYQSHTPFRLPPGEGPEPARAQKP